MHCNQDLSLAYLCVLALFALASTYAEEDKSFNEVEEKGDNLSMYSKLMHYYLKKKQPWMMLPNNGYCFQQPCNTNSDCCRKYNICDDSAHVCIDCWHGYPCLASADCCQRFPNCERLYSSRYGRCTDRESGNSVKRLNWNV